MRASLEFILGLLDRTCPAHVSQEDFQGTHRRALLLWQRMGFLSREPEQNPVASCPHCCEGVPSRIKEQWLCTTCHSPVDPRHLLCWRFDLESLLAWLARQLKLQGVIRHVDEQLWQLGCFPMDDLLYECFFHRGSTLSERASHRLAAYRNALLLHPLPQPKPPAGFQGPCIALLELISPKPPLKVLNLAQLLRTRGNVHLDEGSGALRVGDAWLGEVPVGSKEYFFLVCLHRHLDRFVAYADIKHFVLQQSGSADTTEEATFCQRLKSRIKERKWIPQIDRLIATTNKGSGYRLRGYVEL